MVAARAGADYTAVAKLLHWLIAAFVLALIALGLLMTRTADLGLKFQLYQLHKSFGITVLGLMVLRVAWRLVNPPPPLPQSVHGAERLAAHGGHLGLYLLLLAMPLTGWAMVSAASFALPTTLYGAVPWPHIGPIAALPAAEKKSVEATAKFAHWALGLGLAALVAIHVLAALRHALFLKDGVFSRMMPRLFVRAVPAAFVVLGALAPASAAGPEWAIDPAARVEFEASVAGQPVKGAFKSVAGEITFDPAAPETAEIDVTVPIAGVATGTAEVDSALPGPDWFDAAAHPVARYTATGARPLGDGRYELAGTLALKGKTAPMPIVFTLAAAGGTATVTGTATLDRTAHGVGPKGGVSGVVIGDAVKLSIALQAKRLDN